MKNSIINMIALTLLLLLAACSENAKNEQKKVFFLSPETVDLGTVETDRTIDIAFNIVNDSDENRRISSHAKSCGCTELNLSTKTVKAGHKLKVHLTFDPKNESGRFEKSAFLRLDNSEILVFKFKGTVGK